MRFRWRSKTARIRELEKKLQESIGVGLSLCRESEDLKRRYREKRDELLESYKEQRELLLKSGTPDSFRIASLERELEQWKVCAEQHRKRAGEAHDELESIREEARAAG